MKIRFITLAIISAYFLSCGETNENAKIQNSRSTIVDVSNQLVNLQLEYPSIIGRSRMYILNDYLIVCDLQSPDRGIHIYEKNSQEYITSTGVRGKGPREITRYGRITVDSNNNLFYMPDYGKMKIFRFDMDSVLSDNSYMPTAFFNLNKELFPVSYGLVQDSLIIGTALDVIDSRNFNSVVVSCNLNTGEIKKLSHPHPGIPAKNLTTFFALSEEHNMYVEGYQRNDLLTIHDLDGNLRHNVYGPAWGSKEKDVRHFYLVKTMNDIIVASYSGEQRFEIDDQQRRSPNLPTKFILFNMEGDYLKTLETSHGISRFNVDPDDNRLYIYFEDREESFAYLDLSDIMK